MSYNESNSASLGVPLGVRAFNVYLRAFRARATEPASAGGWLPPSKAGLTKSLRCDALEETLVARIPTSEAFRRRFGNPYGVIHRADVHTSLLEGAQESRNI